MEWTRQKCIISGLVIIAILLTMYLFRHYTIIEGFDISTSSLPSSLSSSEWAEISRLPSDNLISKETLDKVAKIYKENKIRYVLQDPSYASLYITEEDAQYFINNKKWNYSSQMINCLKEANRQTNTDTNKKQGKPPPTEEEINKGVDLYLSMFPPRLLITMFIPSNPTFLPCIKDNKESIFLQKLFTDSNTKDDLEKNYKINDTDYLACDKIDNIPQMKSWDSATNTMKSTQVKYDQFPTLVKGFEFITPVADFAICGKDKIRNSAFSLDGAVSPFYQAFWGVPAGNSSTSTSTSSITESKPATITSTSNEDATKVLKQIKSQLDSMPL
jgi:hypothetical protein